MSRTPVPLPESDSWLIRVYRNPAVGVTASIATILSLFLGIYFYVQSTKNRDLVFFVNPAKAIVVKRGEASQIHVFYGGNELQTDVTAAQIASLESRQRVDPQRERAG
jgi:hypothetical protein